MYSNSSASVFARLVSRKEGLRFQKVCYNKEENKKVIKKRPSSWSGCLSFSLHSVLLLISEASRQDQDLAVNGDRLNTLHAKLHQEADRIRKWKNQTELDLKQKVCILWSDTSFIILEFWIIFNLNPIRADLFAIE